MHCSEFWPPNKCMIILHYCKSRAKLTGLYDIQTRHLLSMPIIPESLSHCWIIYFQIYICCSFIYPCICVVQRVMFVGFQFCDYIIEFR